MTEEGRKAIGVMSEEDKVKEAIEQLEFSARYIVENLEKLNDEDKRKVKNILDELSKVMR